MKVLALCFVFCLCALNSRAASVAPSKPLSLTIEDYVAIVMKQGDVALQAYNSFQNSILSYKSNYRSLRLPKASVSSSIVKDQTKYAEATDKTKSTFNSLNLTQPLYVTGASLTGAVSDRIVDTDSFGTHARTNSNPVYSASVEQPLPLFVGISSHRTWKRSEYGYRSAMESYALELIRIENQARSKYFDVLRKTEELEAVKLKLKASYRSYQITEALVDAGRYAGIELSRAEVRYRADTRNLQNAETDLKRTINDALNFASMRIDSPIQFTSRLDYEPLQITLERLIDYALRHRPDYLAAQRNLELSALTVQETLEENNPQILARGTVSKSDEIVPAQTGSQSMSAGLAMTWPLFDSRVTHLKAETARNLYANDKINFKGLERSIINEVTNSFMDLKTKEDQIVEVRKSRDQARQDIEVVRIRYKSGRDRLVDVFSSEDTLNDLEKEYLDVIIGANTSRDNLAVSVGGRLSEVLR